MDLYEVQELKEILAQKKNIVAIGHKGPDGDSIGSCLALYKLLKEKHEVTVVCPDSLPGFLKWLPNVSDIVIYEDQKKLVKDKINQADLIFTLDFNDLSRTGLLAPLLHQYDGTFVMIDHHQAPKDYATYTYSDPTECSTAQMIYKFICSLGLESRMDIDTATCIYTGIMTDTGSFKFKTTSSVTHKIVADLLKKGVEPQRVYENLFDNNRIERFKMLALSINRIKFLLEGKVAYTYLSQKDLDHHNFQKGDTEGFVNQYLSLKGVKVSVFFQESKKEGIVKISFRSKDNIPVNELAAEYFEGGGHISASGGKSKLSVDATLERFKTIIEDHYHDKI